MNKALVLLASTLVLVSFVNLAYATAAATEDIAGKYIPVNRFGQPAKFGGKNMPRSISDALQSGVMSHPLQNSMNLDEHSAVWVSRHESLNNDGNGPQYVSIVENGDQQGSSVGTSIGFRTEIIRREDRLIIETVAADLWGDGRKAIFEFFADSPAPYSCIRVMRRSYPPKGQTATTLTSTYAIDQFYYPQIPCALHPNPIDEVKAIALDLDPRTNDSTLNDEIVIAYRDSNKGIILGVYTDFPLDTGGVQIAGGNLSLFASPTASVAAELAALNLPNRNSYDLTSCDFDGDGIFEVCLAYSKGTTLNVRVFGFDGFSRSSLVQKYSQSFTSAPSNAKVAVAAHYLGRQGNLQDDLVISVESVPSYYLYIVRINGSDIIAKKFNSLSMGGSPNSYATTYNIHDLAIGDFDGDGQQEITVSHLGVNCYDCPEISVFHYNDTTGSLVKVHRQTYSSSVEEADYVMEIDIARVAKIFTPLAEQLIVMHKGIRIIDMRPFLNLTDVSEVDSDFDVKYFAQFSQPYFPQHTHLGVGKVIESNLKIGPPVHSVYNEVRQVLAVINSPPKHRDYLNGNFIEMGNSDGKTLARITRSSQETQKIGVTQKRDWTVGAGIETDIGRVSASLKTTYGQNFEKTEGSIETVYYQDVSEVSGDDLIIQLQLSWDVWEYPVKNSFNNATSTTILVMFPRMSPTNPNQPDVVMAWVTARTQKEVRSFHEVDNLFSYPEGAPSDITSASYSQQVRTVNGGASVGITVKLSDLTNAGLSTTSTLAFDASLSVSAGTSIPLIGDFGVKLSVTGSYSSSDIRTSEVSLLTSTQLDVEYGPGQQFSTLSYNVRPYIYFARNGYLVLDYAVDFNGDSNTVSQWQQLYNKPDLTWNLPWRWARNEFTNEFDVNQWRTKDMFITPRRPSDGQNVTLTVRLRNYSLKSAQGNFTVQFYLGDFNNAANKFGDTVVVNSLDGRGDASFTLTDVYRSDVYCLYGVIDSEGAVDELHETNNVAYAIIGEPIDTPLCGKIISDKYGDAFGGIPKTPQTVSPTSNAVNMHGSGAIVALLALVVATF